MNPPRGPLLSLPCPAVTLAGRSSQIVPEVIGTQGGPQMSIRIGEHGEPVIIPGRQALRELIEALVEVGNYKFQLDEGIQP